MTIKSILPVSVLASLLITGCQATKNTEADYADAIYHNGNIYTVDNKRTWAEAVAVKNGKFIAVGNNDAILKMAGPSTQRTNLQGNMVIPGLTDAHFHSFNVTSMLDCSPGNFTADKLRDVLEQCKTQQVDGYDWLVINGLEMWEDGNISNDILNELFPDTPVYVREISQHLGLANEKALEIAGINDQTPDPEGGKIMRDPATGKATGLLIEVDAVLMVIEHIPAYPEQTLKNTFEALFQNMLSQGITGFQDAAIMNKAGITLLNKFDTQGMKMPYIDGHIVWLPNQPEDKLAQQESLIQNRAQYETPHVRPSGVKLLLDGVPVPPKPTHVPLKPNGEVDETNLLISRTQLQEKLITWDKAGLRVKMHAAGEGSVRVGLDAIEATRQANGDSGIWHDIVHAADVAAVDMPRFSELRAVAEMSPYFYQAGAGIMGETGFQFRTLLEHGALMTAGSDFNVIPTYNPFPPLEGIVTRPGESLPMEQALALFTINAAMSTGREDELGSIEVGKIANMVVLDRNLFSIAPSDVGETQVVKTILDGEIVFEVDKVAVK